MKLGLEKGKLAFTLQGTKLKGSWTLVKMQKREKDWLLMKHRDDYVNHGKDILEQDKSVTTGRTVEDIKAGRAGADPAKLSPGKVEGARRAPFPATMPPLLASLA